MSDFQVRSDNVDVEQIMRQIRARIREKRGVDYTEDEIRELANVKLEKFLDPKGVRSDLLQQYRAAREASLPPNYKFEDTTLYDTHRGFLRFMRRLLNPILKLFFNPTPIVEALHIQSKLNATHAAMEPLHYELMHNLVIELTRTTIELKNLKMRLESVASRLDFDERRARALEGVVQYRPGSAVPLQPPTGAVTSAPPAPGSHNELDNEGNERRSRRRRRRGRRRGAGGPDERGPRMDGRADAHEAGEGTSAAAPPSEAPGEARESRPSAVDHRPSDRPGSSDGSPADDDQ